MNADHLIRSTQFSNLSNNLRQGDLCNEFNTAAYITIQNTYDWAREHSLKHNWAKTGNSLNQILDWKALVHFTNLLDEEYEHKTI